MDSRYVVVEFWGGPLDGFHNGWTTNMSVLLPETLTARFARPEQNGAYHIRVRGVDHYIYQWFEAVPK